MTLTEFLLARIGEEEAGADRFRSDVPASRILAECEAKRHIIDAAWDDFARVQDEYGGGWHGRDESEAANLYPDVLKWLAWVNRHHPAYDERWRP